MSRTFFSIILVPRDNALITVSLGFLIMGNLIFTRYLTKKTRRLVATRPTRPAINHFICDNGYSRLVEGAGELERPLEALFEPSSGY